MLYFQPFSDARTRRPWLHRPDKVQVALFSATMPLEVLEVTTRFMRDPIRILVKRDELTLEGIKQFYIAVEREEWKLDTLV